MPTTDPIIDEIHSIREALAQEAGFDAEKIAEAARKRQVESGVKGGHPLAPASRDGQ